MFARYPHLCLSTVVILLSQFSVRSARTHWLVGKSSCTCLLRAASLTMQLACSALYHVPAWGRRTRTWLRRLDHAAIFALIAGTYTPLCMLALDHAAARRLLLIEWGAAAVGIVSTPSPAFPSFPAQPAMANGSGRRGLWPGEAHRGPPVPIPPLHRSTLRDGAPAATCQATQPCCVA